MLCPASAWHRHLCWHWATTTEYLEDGSYIVKELYIVESNYNARSTEYTKEHHLAVIQYSASDKVLWTYDLYGTFTIVEGVSCVATASSYETTINNSTWHFSNGSSRCVDCYVYGAGTFKHKILGITTKTINIDVRIECDEYGNITA